MTFWDLTLLDLVALAMFLCAWLGYAPFLRWRGRGLQVHAAAMMDHRRAWMHEYLGRDLISGDIAIVGHIMSTASFFASTTVIVIGALAGVLVHLGPGSGKAPSTWLSIAQPSVLELKIVLILVLAVYAFQCFTWSIRQANFAAVVMGAAPPLSTLNTTVRNRLAASMGSIITGVAESYDNGVRAYFFGIAAVTWIVNPLLLMLATTGVVTLLLRRQTRSRTAVALKEIAALRMEMAPGPDGTWQDPSAAPAGRT